MNREWHFDDIVDKFRQEIFLDLRVSVDCRIGVDLNEIWIKIVVQQEVKAEELEAAELAIQLIFDHLEYQAHYFLDFLVHLGWILIFRLDFSHLDNVID